MARAERIYQVDRIKVENSGEFSVVDEEYGYSVRPGPQDRRRATLVEWAAQYLGFLSLFAMTGAVASSTGLSLSNVGTFDIGILLLGLTSATGFFFIGTRGTAHELQVDMVRRELRTAIRNWKGTTRILETYAMGNIESAFVRSRGFPVKYGQYLVRTTKTPAGTALLQGNQESLRHLHGVLSRAVADRQEYLGRTVSRPISTALNKDGQPNGMKAEHMARLTEMARAKVKPQVTA